MLHYCECGREIRVEIGGKWGPPPDANHDLCKQCYESIADSLRNA